MSVNIESIKKKMLVKYPFFGSVVANINYKENNEIPTAGTDGKTIYYNSEFLKNLNSEEQMFIFAHEVCHIAFNHIIRSEGKDPEVWNIATDAVINQFLKRDGLKIVEGGVDIAEAINYDAEQLYDKLLKEKQQSQSQNGESNQPNNQGSSSSEQEQNSIDKSQNQSQNGQSNQPNNQGSSSSEQEQNSIDKSQNQRQNGESNQQNNQGSSSSEQEQNSIDESQSQLDNQSAEKNHDIGHDTHSMWKDAIKRKKEAESNDRDESQSDKEKSDEQKQKEEKLQQAIKKISEMGIKNAFNKNMEEKRKELEELKKILSQEITSAGTKTNCEQRPISNIGKSKPLIDWRYVLREAIKYDVDWSYRNAFIEDGVISANLEEQPMPETEIVLDTSGSINDLLLRNFLRECKNILQHTKLKVGCFDTEFYGFVEIRTEKDIENMKFVGGGGTDFNVAVEAFSRRVENKIIFTDGEAPMPNTAIDAIWIVFGGIKIKPRGGKVIQINEEQLDRLYSDREQLDRMYSDEEQLDGMYSDEEQLDRMYFCEQDISHKEKRR